MFPQIEDALKRIGLSGLSFHDIEGRGRAKGEEMVLGRGARTYRPEYVERTKIEIIVNDSEAQSVIQTILKNGKTGLIGDGKIFVSSLGGVFDITSGEADESAISVTAKAPARPTNK